MTTPEQRQQWRELCDEATSGPWVPSHGSWSSSVVGRGGEYQVAIAGRRDADLIALARSALPALLDENDALRAEIERLKVALVEACEIGGAHLIAIGSVFNGKSERVEQARHRLAELARKVGGK